MASEKYKAPMCNPQSQEYLRSQDKGHLGRTAVEYTQNSDLPEVDRLCPSVNAGRAGLSDLLMVQSMSGCETWTDWYGLRKRHIPSLMCRARQKGRFGTCRARSYRYHL